MKKVCVLTSAHPAKDARIFYKEARSLAQAGYKVVLIAQAPAGRLSSVPGEETADGVRLLYFPPVSNRWQRLLNVRALYTLARDQEADIYHFHDPDLIPVGLALQKNLGRPVIYDIHEYYSDSLKTRHWVPAPLRRPIAAIFDRYEKRAARRLAGVVTVNAHMAEQFAAVNPRGIVLHNYALQNQFAGPFPTEESFKGVPRILYLGSINRERGLEVILEAMPRVVERFPQATCTLVGPVDPGGLDERYLPLDPWLERGHIRLTGAVPYEEVPAIMARSTLALVPLLPTLNYQKAIPVKLIEYMAAGLPVVGSRFGHIERIVEETGCGQLALPGDAEDLAAVIGTLLADPAQAWQCAQRGRKAFRECYSWESEEPKLLAFYRDLLAQT